MFKVDIGSTGLIILYNMLLVSRMMILVLLPLLLTLAVCFDCPADDSDGYFEHETRCKQALDIAKIEANPNFSVKLRIDVMSTSTTMVPICVFYCSP